jgi:hypothetical protein
MSLMIEYRLLKRTSGEEVNLECPLETTSLNLHKLVDQWKCVIMNYSMRYNKSLGWWREVFNKRRDCINSDVRFKLIFYRKVYTIESQLTVYNCPS